MYVKSNTVRDVTSRLNYIFDTSAHDHSGHRVLATAGHNVHFWGLRGHIYRQQSGYFIAQQFATVREQSKAGRGKRHQAQHLILSFADDEFATNDATKLPHEADQVNQLIAGFMAQHFGDNAQWTSGVQCDGKGHKLHAHLMVNSVDINGKTIPTNKFTVWTLRNQWNRYLEQHYQQVTGRTYHNPFEQPKDVTTKPQHGWQADLREQLFQARDHSQSMDDYVARLKQQGVTISERNKAGDLSYHVTVNGKAKTVRDFYQRKNKKTGEVKATRGIGKEFTPLALKQYFQFKNKEENQHEQREAESKSEQPGVGRPVPTVDNPIGQISSIAARIQREQQQQLVDDLKRRQSHQRTDQDGPSAGQ